MCMCMYSVKIFLWVERTAWPHSRPESHSVKTPIIRFLPITVLDIYNFFPRQSLPFINSLPLYIINRTLFTHAPQRHYVFPSYFSQQHCKAPAVICLKTHSSLVIAIYLVSTSSVIRGKRNKIGQRVDRDVKSWCEQPQQVLTTQHNLAGISTRLKKMLKFTAWCV